MQNNIPLDKVVTVVKNRSTKLKTNKTKKVTKTSDEPQVFTQSREKNAAKKEAKKRAAPKSEEPVLDAATYDNDGKQKLNTKIDFKV
ncbi:hypothetical protein FLL45_06020 [Aliikangiella marina]|uniref:Uncharacterized protein n=1 Tax=Aliikangiella marina TaxID=1712262 RepID=A0A545TJW3_9GAMM|nr:hypothetical protein [Aliikangiella marina]TQV77497.1 hypothetical protein FLL45_06020 [Aliikangiella marina]